MLEKLSESIVRTAFIASGNEPAAELFGGLYTYLLSKSQDRHEASLLEKKILTGVETRLNMRLTPAEFSAIDARWLESELNATINKFNFSRLAVDGRGHADRIEEALLNVRPVEMIVGLGPDQIAAYKVAITAVSQTIAEVAMTMPNFKEYAAMESLVILDTIASSLSTSQSSIDEIRTSVNKIEATISERTLLDLESYKSALARKYDFVEVLGLEAPKKLREARLSVSYVSLNLVNEDVPPIDFADMLNLVDYGTRRLIIEGPAGSGKSTLCRWVSLNALNPEYACHLKLGYRRDFVSEQENLSERGASTAHARIIYPWGQKTVRVDGDLKSGFRTNRDVWEATRQILISDKRNSFFQDIAKSFAAHWAQSVPILIRIRDFDKVPSTNLDFVKRGLHAISFGDSGGFEEYLNTGRCVVMFDGLDEAPESTAQDPNYRANLCNFMLSFINTYPRNFYILTSRPGAVVNQRDWMDASFNWTSLAELDDTKRDIFIRRWFENYADVYAEDRSSYRSIIARGRSLSELIKNRPAVSHISRNPLLCSSICILFENLGQAIPDTPTELFEAMSMMITYNRAQSTGQSGRAVLEVGGGEASLKLTRDEMNFALARIAVAMLRGSVSRISYTQAVRLLSNLLSSSDRPQCFDGASILKHMVERCGLLRLTESIPGDNDGDQIEFIHNYFMSFYAAKEFIDEHCVEELVQNFDKEGYKQSIKFSCGLAPRNFRNELVKRFEENFENSTGKERKAFAVTLIGCYAAARNVDSEPRIAASRLGEAINPVQSEEEASTLIEAGPEIVPHIGDFLRSSRNSGLKEKEVREHSRLSVRVLRYIGGSEAIGILREVSGTAHHEVACEIAREIEPLTIPAIAKHCTSLSWTNLPADVRANVRDIPDGFEIGSRLYLSGTSLTSLDGLGGKLSKLNFLSIHGSSITDISALSEAHQLETLYMSNTPVTDLSCLGDLSKLSVLGIDNSDAHDLSPIAHLQLSYAYVSNVPSDELAKCRIGTVIGRPRI